MSLRLYTIRSDCYNPYHNQAIEEYLLNSVDENSVILYLWQNDNTVFIGKNQNAYDEARIEELENNKGYLARRISGGGAVYHDLGNLNFTFVSSKNNYDLDKHNEVILKAMSLLGIEAYKNGRNDLLIDGRKFSGHAYYLGKQKCFHHGTIMLDVDEDKLQKYLNVSLLKLKSKNVSSVKSRVINLKQINDKLDVEMVVDALIQTFKEVYDGEITTLHEKDLDLKELEKLENKFANPEWKYGMEIDYPYVKEKRFDWGTVKIKYDLFDDYIKDIVIYTDSLDTDVIENIPEMLIGKRLSKINDSCISQINDVIKMMKENDYEI